MSEALRLGPEHAEALEEAQNCYPSGLRETLPRLKDKLTLLDQSDFTSAWGLFEGNSLIAYVIAFPRKSLLEGRSKETVLGIDDLWVSPRHTGKLYSLLKILHFDLEEAQLAHLDIEALSRRSFYRLVEQHPEVFRRIGYEVLGSYVYWEDRIGEEMCWVRFSPLIARERKVGNDEVELSDALLEEMSYGWESE
jgi:hypothetical protein